MALSTGDIQALISAAMTESTQALTQMFQHSQAQQAQAMEEMFSRLLNTGAAARGPGAEGHGSRTEKLDARQFTNLQNFSGAGWKDWAFKFSNSAGASSALALRLLGWAAAQQEPIDDFLSFPGEESDEVCNQISLQIFYQLSLRLEGEPLQKLHTCGQSGLEAWRQLHRKYAPTTALRGMQLMMSVVNPPKAKSPKDVSKCLDVWETRLLQLKRDFNEGLSSKMKSAILVNMLPSGMQDSIFANAERF